MTARYYVIATQDSTTLSQPLAADNDNDATFEAMRYVMDRAYNDPAGPWGRGEIQLVDKGASKVLRTMTGKD
jgi:hypothetical protein